MCYQATGFPNGGIEAASKRLLIFFDIIASNSASGLKILLEVAIGPAGDSLEKALDSRFPGKDERFLFNGGTMTK